MDELKQEKLVGMVDSVTFRKEETGFTVLELEHDGELDTVVGSMPEVYAGEKLTVYGQWQSHPTFGPQFRADSFEREMPATAAAILRYLSGGAIKGIGPATAAKIVELFGDQTLYVIENEPQRLAKVKGISEEKALEIADRYKAQAGLGEAIALLARYSVTATEAMAVWRTWGPATFDMVESNPYVLCQPELGIGFDRVDEACSRLERPIDDFGRLAAGVKHILYHNQNSGHTCLPREKLVPVAARRLSQELHTIEETIESLVDYEELVVDELGDREFVFITDAYNTETYCAGRILALMQYTAKPIGDYQGYLEIIQKLKGTVYESRQLEAIDAAMTKGFLVLTGGPGTGKTTTLDAIISILESYKQTVAIAAPTGRAAKRITEVTGRDAKTIHRLLEVKWGINDVPYFERNQHNPLECDALIVDELSMTDAVLFEALLRAVPTGCRLILVGDSDQLPSVGAGNVLRDLIRSGRVPVVQLTEVFRQAQTSAIVTNAHLIVEGKMPNLALKNSDFFFLESDSPSVVADTIEDLYFRRLPKAYNLSPLSDIQVLCPGRKNLTGTRELNRRLQARMNPPHPDRSEHHLPGVVFRVGDKVMQTKNNYDVPWKNHLTGEEGTGIFNGDIGLIQSIDHISGMM